MVLQTMAQVPGAFDPAKSSVIPVLEEEKSRGLVLKA